MMRDVEKPSSLSSGTLKEVLKGRSQAVTKAEALRILEAKRDDTKHLTFAEVVRNPAERPTVRYRAAVALANSKHTRKSQILTEQLGRAKHPDLIDGFLYGLAYAGNRDAFRKVVQKERQLDKPYLKQRAALAKTLLAFRHQLDGFEFAPVRKSQLLELPRDASAFRLTAMDRETLSQVHKDLEGNMLALTPSGRGGYKATCNAGRWALVWNDEVVKKRDPDWLAENKAIVALLAYADGLIEEYNPWFYLLSQPRAQRVRGEVMLTGINLRGNVVLSGSGALADGKLGFELASVRANGMFPCDARGTLDLSRWTVSGFAGRSSRAVYRKARKRKVPRLARA